MGISGVFLGPRVGPDTPGRGLEGLEDLVDPVERLLLPAHHGRLLLDVLLLGQLPRHQLLHKRRLLGLQIPERLVLLLQQVHLKVRIFDK